MEQFFASTSKDGNRSSISAGRYKTRFFRSPIKSAAEKTWHDETSRRHRDAYRAFRKGYGYE